MERLSRDELSRVRRLSEVERKSPEEVAREMRIDERTVCRVLAGFEVHRATARSVRDYLSGAGGGGRI